MDERLEEIKRLWNEDNDICEPCDYEWLIQQAEKAQELENRNKELEYASKYNGELNEFLQKRKLPPKTLGRHVVGVVMDYVKELERRNKELAEGIEFNNKEYGKVIDENNRYKEALEFYGNEINYQVFIQNGKSNIERDGGEKARQEMKGVEV